MHVGIHVDDYRRVVRVACGDLGHEFSSVAAVELIVGTALVESGLRRLRQVGGGPALGLLQEEPATYRDLWVSYLAYRPGLAARFLRAAGRIVVASARLEDDLRLGVLAARLHYWRVPEPLPDPTDVGGLGYYWKDHWNTAAGRGRVEDFVALYRAHAGGETE